MVSPFSFGFSGDDIDNTDDLVGDPDLQSLRLGDGLQDWQWKPRRREEEDEDRLVRYEPRWYTLDELVRPLFQIFTSQKVMFGREILYFVCLKVGVAPVTH